MPITSTALSAPVAGPRANPPDELTTLQALVAHANEVKVELALARGKQAHDKRQDIARRDAQREVVRELGRRAKGNE